MDHFSFTQVCRVCKKNSKTFKIYLSNYDDNGFFVFSKEKQDIFSFICCGTINTLNFEEICNPYTINYLRRENEIYGIMDEIDNRIDKVIVELLKIEKLKISTTDSL